MRLQDLPATMAELSPTILSHFPPTLLQSGDADILTESSRVVRRLLEAQGVSVSLVVFPGFHGFLGFPIQWMQQLFPPKYTFVHSTLPATRQLVAFLRDGLLPPNADHADQAPPGSSVEEGVSGTEAWRAPLDPSMPFVLSVFVVAAAAATAGGLGGAAALWSRGRPRDDAQGVEMLLWTLLGATEQVLNRPTLLPAALLILYLMSVLGMVVVGLLVRSYTPLLHPSDLALDPATLRQAHDRELARRQQ